MGSDADRGDEQAAENFDHDGFFRKARKFAGKIPFVPDAVAAYYAMVDPRTPLKYKVVIAGALVYFVAPVDALPDVIPGVGFADDAAAVAAALGAVSHIITDEHRQRARQFLG